MSLDEGKKMHCPITREAFTDPVLAADGHTYERWAIESWVQIRATSPLTGLCLGTTCVVPNHALRSAMQDLRRWKLRIRAMLLFNVVVAILSLYVQIAALDKHA